MINLMVGFISAKRAKIVEALTEFGMLDSKSVYTPPIITGLSLDKIMKTDPKVQAFPYHTAIGTLNYIAQSEGMMSRISHMMNEKFSEVWSTGTKKGFPATAMKQELMEVI